MDQHISEVAVESSSVQNMNPQMELLPEIVVEHPSQQNNDGEIVQPSIEKKSAALPRADWKNLILLPYKTLGIVFGSMSTSPLYLYGTMQLDSPTRGDYLGIFSIIFWTITLSGVVKYGTIALEADDEGEGGTFALYSLLCKNMDISLLPSRRAPRSANNESKSKLAKYLEKSILAKRTLLFVAILGMCMMIGDGIITPAISVLSAIDGLRAPFPSINNTMVEVLSAAVLIVLFLLQSFGTSRVSFLFSPIMAAWTFSTMLLGIYNIAYYHPAVLKGISPHYIILFFLRNGKQGWLLLGGTIISVTGSEALYADMGNFNRKSIRMAFMCVIYPSLVLTYAGQTAYLIKHPGDFSDGFYKSIPHVVYWPMFLMATLAAVIASQSLISAVFSVIKQSVALDYCPRVKVVHTSTHKEGEVYSPEVNYALMLFCVVVIVVFGDGKSAGNAYGIVVCILMLITTILLAVVMITIWRTPKFLVALYLVIFLLMEGVYVSAVLTKVAEDGWIPLATSLCLSFVMLSWFYGRRRKIQFESAYEINIETLPSLLSDQIVQRVPGVCFFYSNNPDVLTPVFGHYIKTVKSLSEVTIIITLRCLSVPKVPSPERFRVTYMGIKGVYGCYVEYGWADSLDFQDDKLINDITDGLREHLQISSQHNHGEIEEEIHNLTEGATLAGVVHVRGKTKFHIGRNCRLIDRIMLVFYEFMHSNCRSALPVLDVVPNQQMDIVMFYET